MNRQLMSKFLEVRRGIATGSFVAAIVTGWVLAGVALAAGPTTRTAPSIQGTPVQEGKALTFAQGMWDDATTVTITDSNWQLCAATCTDTGQSAASPYTIPANTAGGTIEVVEQATATDGTSTLTATSAAILPAAPTTLGSPSPSVLGPTAPPQQGQTLTAVHGGWSPSPTTIPTTFTDVWERCLAGVCSQTGSTGPTYLVGPADVGHTIEFVESAANAGGPSASTETSTATAAVLPLPPGNLAAPTIAGTAQQGQVLTVTPGTWANNPTSIAEQWEECTTLVCTAIPGQSGTSYAVAAGDVGHTIRVLETDSNAASLGVVKASAQTATASATSATSVVAFSQSTPSTNQTVTLVATVSSNSGNGNPHGSLSFFNGSNAVPGCANKGVNGGLATTIVCQTSFGAGQPQISAAYVPDPASLVAGSSSDTTSVNVGKGPTSILLAVTPRVAPSGRATYVATLGVPLANAGSVLPFGSIDFLDGGQPIAGCTNQVLSSLTATCSVSYASAGAHTITARYDGDANFTGSTSSASGVQIVTGAPRAPVVRGRLGSTLGWKLFYHPRYSEMSELEAFAIAKGTTILIQCTGKGCPFASREIKRASGQFDLLRPFRHRHLHAGARITVRFTRKHWVGKYYSITIRPGRKPKIIETCLAPGGVKPGAGCRSK
jgi:hypothetical protein